MPATLRLEPGGHTAMTISRRSRFFALFALLGMAAVPLACTTTGVIRIEEGDKCAVGETIRLTTGDKDMEKSLAKGEYGKVNCPTTTYHLPLKNPQPGDSSEFTYSFLELNERKPTELKSPKQWEDLDTVLTNGKRKYVITFIHGWRNDASLKAPDDRRFRTLLTYSRQFLNYRCRKERRYCDTQLVGVFIGWRGALIEEIGENYSFPAVLWTFWNRKQKSEQHGEGIIRHIKAIESRLNLDPGNPDADKMLVLGHSFGGNMLATALQQCLTGEGNPNVFCGEDAGKIKMIADYKPGEEAAPPLGDLTVIVNPAAEVKKWSDIQRAVRKRNGYRDDPKSDQIQVDRLFQRDQRATYIALTSTKNWSDEDRCQTVNGKKVCSDDYDWATGEFFRIGQFYKKDFEEKIGIGHFLPTKEHPYGASHEAVTNQNDTLGTNIQNGLDPANSACEIQDGWLWQARGYSEALERRSYWDTFTKDFRPRNRLFVRRNYPGEENITPQFRLGLSPAGEGAGSRQSFEPRNTPFWSVRTAPSVIPEHNSYINYPLWCILNQMVLDDVTKH